MNGSPPTLETDRLRLVCCTLESLTLDGAPSGGFARWLGARVPESWPPELYDDSARSYNARFLTTHPDQARWSMWYVVLVEQDPGSATLVGLVGATGAPDPEGMVEVGYGILPEFRRLGLATEATGRLIDHAFADPTVTRVAASTYPELTTSIGVMMRNRMRFQGPGAEPGTVRYEVTREVWAAR